MAGVYIEYYLLLKIAPYDFKFCLCASIFMFNFFFLICNMFVLLFVFSCDSVFVGECDEIISLLKPGSGTG